MLQPIILYIPPAVPVVINAITPHTSGENPCLLGAYSMLFPCRTCPTSPPIIQVQYVI